MAGTLTVANSSLIITVEGLYPSGVRLEGYAADNVFETAAVENAEIVMGVDGKLSAGYVFNPIQFTVNLQADSPSLDVFESIWQREASTRDKLRVGFSAALPSTNKRYVLRDGFFQSYQAPQAQRTLQPASAVFMFSRIEFTKIN